MVVQSFRYAAMIGVGGIGIGKFFELNGSHTLGREESRSGKFLDRRDYCKLHIISHYVHTLMGSGFRTLMLGKLGDDEWGHALYEEMQHTGLDLRYVAITPGEQTLFGLCLIYPDGSGGNIMTADSACASVDAACVQQAKPEFERYTGQGIALAVPEVPLETRLHLLQTASSFQFLRAASLTSEELRSEMAAEIIALTDLLAINLDEAAALAHIPFDRHSAEAIVEKAVHTLTGMNATIMTSITAGGQGSWFWNGHRLSHLPALKVPVVSTAGAGDAFLAGILTGMAAGLLLPESLELARLVAAHSLTSAHTINPITNRITLLTFAQEVLPEVLSGVTAFLSRAE
jgi:ribokinase